MFTTKQFVEAEYNAFIDGNNIQISNRLAHAFIPFTDNERYNLRKFINTLIKESSLMSDIQFEVSQLVIAAQKWEKDRNNVSTPLIGF